MFPALLALLLAMPGRAAEPFSTADPLKAFVHGEYAVGSDYFARGREGTYLFRCELAAARDGIDGVAISEMSIWGNRTGPWEAFERRAGGSFTYAGTRTLRDTSCLEHCPIGAYLATGQCAWRKGWPPAPPCESQPEHRELDFWLGEWTVLGDGKPIAVSRIGKAAAGCVVTESYEQADGFSGKSINFYDPLLRKWRQTWAESTGNASEFSGAFRDKAMRFEGETHRAGGPAVLRRMTLFDLGNGEVRQLSERSLDGGRTWGPHYDFRYVRRTARQPAPGW
jgi:hypothetical protein